MKVNPIFVSAIQRLQGGLHGQILILAEDFIGALNFLLLYVAFMHDMIQSSLIEEGRLYWSLKREKKFYMVM
ncbi:hypothetical protein REPUB_Repub06bG0151800 [Reevesia pubescens]